MGFFRKGLNLKFSFKEGFGIQLYSLDEVTVLRQLYVQGINVKEALAQAVYKRKANL